MALPLTTWLWRIYLKKFIFCFVFFLFDYKPMKNKKAFHGFVFTILMDTRFEIEKNLALTLTTWLWHNYLKNFIFVFYFFSVRFKSIFWINKKAFHGFAFTILMEAPPRFELGNKDFADLRLTTWLWRHLER